MDNGELIRLEAFFHYPFSIIHSPLLFCFPLNPALPFPYLCPLSQNSGRVEWI